jgi:fucose permease
MTGFLRPVTEVTISASFTFGVLLSLLGSLKLTLSRSMDLREGSSAGLLRSFNLALMLMMLLSGVLIDGFGAQPILILSSVLAAAAVFALSFSGSVPHAFIAVLTGGLGGAGLCTASVVLMPEAFFPDRPTASVNTGLVFFALGALVAPPLLDVLFRVVGSKRALALLSLTCLIPGVLAAIAPPAELQGGGNEPLDMVSLLSRNSLWFACLVSALYAPLEASISIWANSYLAHRGSGERQAARFLSGFWGALVASRLLFGVLLMSANNLHANWDAWALVIPALLAAIALGNMAGMIGTGRAGRGLLLVGFCLGPIAPTLFGMMFTRLDQSTTQCHGTALGTILAAGSLGSLIFLPLIASIARKESPQSALRVSMLGALLLTAVALLFGLST